MMEDFALARVLKFLPGIILGLTIHEFSHAYVSHRCGDTTAMDQGRITLNPFKHIDLLGFIMLLIAGFGWAKPVQFNEERLKNPQRDVMKIAIAGPLSNAFLAILVSVVYVLVGGMVPYYSNTGMQILNEVFLYAIYINWSLFVFNLIPIPPLDGSHLLFNYFRRYPALHDGLYKYGSYAFILIIIITMVTKINLLPIWPAVQYLGDGLLSLLNGLL